VTLTVRLLPASVGLAALCLAVGYAQHTLWSGVLTIAVGGCIWLVALWRRWTWTAPVGLSLSTVAAAVGLWLGAGDAWMIAGLIAALSAWDLEHLVRNVRSVGRVDDEEALERHHLVSLLIVDALGFGLAFLALNLTIQFSFGVIVLLVMLLILALSRVVGIVRRESN
jgi:hypothetical protein